MSDEPLGFEEHRRRRDAGLVTCGRCQRAIPANVRQCPKCGIPLGGVVGGVARPALSGSRALAWAVVVVLLLVVVLLTALPGRW
jgi:predicted amidophosphoribosyltransferase